MNPAATAGCAGGTCSLITRHDPDSAYLASQQHDIYLRYSFLHDIIEQVFVSQGTEPLRVLDIGCGATRLTEASSRPMATVIRADVDDFGDPDIVVLKPDAPLPFERCRVRSGDRDRGPGARAARRGGRLAGGLSTGGPRRRGDVLPSGGRRRGRRGGCIFHRPWPDRGQRQRFPARTPDIWPPSVAEITDVLSAGSWQVKSIPNAPIDQWLLFNLVDLIYAYDFGSGVKKNTFNQTLNSGAPAA